MNDKTQTPTASPEANDSPTAQKPATAASPESNAPAAAETASSVPTPPASSEPAPHGTAASGAGTGTAPAPPALNEPPFSRVDGGDDVLRRGIVDMLRTCYDPEIPVDIWELGLIYRVDIDPNSNVSVQMTLTSPMCPVAGSLPPEVESKIAGVHGVRDARVDLVWDPTWNKDMMSQAALVKLNMV